jgi:hypothetical protein
MIASTSAPRSDHLCRSIIATKSLLILMRMYGPEQAWIDKTWRSGELELMD